jgi:uncharacterized protein (TIGR03437 family)
VVATNAGAARTTAVSIAGISISVTQQGTGATVSVTALQNAASYASGPIAPGEIVVLYGSGMGPTQLTQFQPDSNGSVPLQLAGTRVLFNGLAAPIIYTRTDQVSAVVPYGVTGSTASIVVQYQGQPSAPLAVSLATASPGLFTTGSGTGQAAATNQDGSYNSPSNPARMGSIVTLYSTGEGQTSPGGVDGKPAVAPLPHPVLPVFVTIGGVSAEVDYAGGAPGEVAGVMQINVRIPSIVQPGSAVPVAVQVGTASGPTGVTIAVQGN